MIDDKTCKRWKKGIKKKEADEAKKRVDEARRRANENKLWDDITVVQEKINDRPAIPSNHNVCVRFPKIAEDLIDGKVFGENVNQEVNRFRSAKLPSTLDKIEVVKDVFVEVNDFSIYSLGVGTYYPTVFADIILSGKLGAVNGFEKTLPGNDFYWKGSFLKNKTSGLITGIKLTNIAYVRTGQQLVDWEEVLLV
jgi:hypothetical protein